MHRQSDESCRLIVFFVLFGTIEQYQNGFNFIGIAFGEVCRHIELRRRLVFPTKFDTIPDVAGNY